MSKENPEIKQKLNGSLWLQINKSHPIKQAIREVEVTPENRRWMEAPEFSKNRYIAKPYIKKLNFFQAMIILFKAKKQKIDVKKQRLEDIENLIISGHYDAAESLIEKFKIDFPDFSEKCLGLYSLNLYNKGQRETAIYFHELALFFESAHPVMIEIFGTNIRNIKSLLDDDYE